MAIALDTSNGPAAGVPPPGPKPPPGANATRSILSLKPRHGASSSARRRERSISRARATRHCGVARRRQLLAARLRGCGRRSNGVSRLAGGHARPSWSLRRRTGRTCESNADASMRCRLSHSRRPALVAEPRSAGGALGGFAGAATAIDRATATSEAWAGTGGLGSRCHGFQRLARERRRIRRRHTSSRPGRSPDGSRPRRTGLALARQLEQHTADSAARFAEAAERRARQLEAAHFDERTRTP